MFSLDFWFYIIVLYQEVTRRLFCRYHYNVMDVRVDQHIDKGKEDGLYISCVASSANMWAIVMDAGTGFTSQVYELSPVFLHKVAILENTSDQLPL